MVNEAARSLGRLAKGKPKTMSKAAITQRKRAAKASAKARKGRKRKGKTLVEVFKSEGLPREIFNKILRATEEIDTENRANENK